MAPRKDNLLNIVLGNPGPFFADHLDLSFGQQFLDVFKNHGFFDIDTARSYDFGEKSFGQLKVHEQGFTIDTKVLSFFPGAHQSSSIHSSVSSSLSILGVNKVHILYLHSPDRATPFKETLLAINEEYKKGRFEKLGLSNYTADEVRQILSIVDSLGLVRPTVYQIIQGNYNLLTRKGEKELFPLLKKEKIAFYAWSPLAGGVLAGRHFTKEDIIANTARFSNDRLAPTFLSLFAKDSIFNGVKEYTEFLKKKNFTPTEVALRWLAYHSLLSKEDGDAIILGASKPEQFESNLQELERGPLPKEIVDYVDTLWEKVKEESPAYHF